MKHCNTVLDTGFMAALIITLSLSKARTDLFMAGVA